MENKNALEKFQKFFTAFRILVTIWNAIMVCYHHFGIGIDGWTSIVFQLTALGMEYLLAYPYERALVYIDRMINDKTRFVGWPKKEFIRFFGKSTSYMIIFAALYLTTYWLRLQFFYQIHWGVEISELNQSMVNMYWFTLLAGPALGFFVVWRKKRNKKKAEIKRQKEKRFFDTKW